MQSGELIVTGSSKIVIPLHHRAYPSLVRVHFKDDGPGVAPCDPGNVDTLEFEVESNSTGALALVIFWSVSSVREVKWQVSY